MFQIAVKEHSKEEHQPELYKKINSYKKARNFILRVKSNTESAEENIKLNLEATAMSEFLLKPIPLKFIVLWLTFQL